tara:strand:- start:25386 stop:25901 length:516 start_codon:yes stop_codon:yes gene_type:complete
MAVIRKASPVGIDSNIDKLQDYLYNKLAWSNYESYHRAYKNQKDNTLIPEVYTSNGNYEEVYFNDNYSATSFFLVDDNRSVEDISLTTNVSIIFQVKLDKLFPSVSHRADEEVVNQITKLINLNSKGFDLTGITQGIDNVYSGLNLDLPTNTDMSNFFVVKFDMNLQYENC